MRNDGFVVDLEEIFHELMNHWKFIAILVIVCAGFSFIVSSFFMTEQYESKARIYLKPEREQDSAGYDDSSINANQMMVYNYIVMMKGDTIMEEVAEKIGKGYTKDQIRNSLVILNTEDTEVLELIVTTDSPEISRNVVNTLISCFSQKVVEELNLNHIVVVDKASYDKTPVSPVIPRYIVLGAVTGFLLAIGFIGIKSITNNRLKNRESVESYLGIPVLASIPYKTL